MNSFQKWLDCDENVPEYVKDIIKNVKPRSHDSKAPKKKVLFVTTPRVGSKWLNYEFTIRKTGRPDEFYLRRAAKAYARFLNATNFQDYTNKLIDWMGVDNMFFAKVHVGDIQGCYFYNYDILKDFTHIYRLERKDIIAQAYSMLKCEKHDDWWHPPYFDKFSDRDMVKKIREIQSWNKWIEQYNHLFRKHFLYEDFVDHGITPYVKDIYEDLGIDFTDPVEENLESPPKNSPDQKKYLKALRKRFRALAG